MSALRRWRRSFGRWWRRWSTVAIAIVVSTLLALVGLIGAGKEQPLRGERFDRKQIIIRPASRTGVRITEVVDIDFGRFSRHGYERLIPDDSGKPLEVVASSTANDEVKVSGINSYGSYYGSADTYQIRIGSVDEVFSGHQRYTLSYTLPEFDTSEGVLGIDVIGADDELPTDRLDVYVVGFGFESTTCWIGYWRSTDKCAIESIPGGYAVHIDDLPARSGLTFEGENLDGGDIVTVDGAVEPTLAPPVTRPWRLRWREALFVLLAGLATVGVLFLIRRLFDLDRVAEGDGIAAAFPDEVGAGDRSDRKVPVDMTTTSGLAELSATEFAPPDGIRPWQAAIVVNEAVDDRSVRAWFSEMIALGALVPKLVGDETAAQVRRLSVGDPAVLNTLSEFDRELIGSMVSVSDVVHLDRSTIAMREAWARLVNEQDRFARSSRWWRHRVPQFHAEPLRRANWSVISFLLVIYLILGWVLSRSFLGPFALVGYILSPIAMAIGLVAVWIVWASSQRVTDAPSRSVLGSAIAIRVLGFRKFLLGSEGAHVDAAWDRSRIREYSAWAIALNAAEAWSDQIATPSLAEPQFNMFSAVGEAISNLDIDLSTSSSYRPYTDRRANPWRDLGQLIESASRHMGESSKSGGGWNSWSSSSSGGSSGGGVGSGGGGGHSGSW